MQLITAMEKVLLRLIYYKVVRAKCSHQHSFILLALAGLFPKILVNDVRQLPIRIAGEQSQLPFIQKADEMRLLNEQYQKEKNDFLKIFTLSFPVSKITNKIENWYETDFLAFQTELKEQKIEIIFHCVFIFSSLSFING